ncbi:MAG: hypothetical protein WDN45_00765 [Caulobacteraceae bacterium]
MSDADVIIYHNPKCGTSRKHPGPHPRGRHRADRGRIPQGRLDQAPAQGHPQEARQESARHLRIRGNEAHEHIIANPNATDDEILDAMVGHPILSNGRS